jgi:hypothetical protein
MCTGVRCAKLGSIVRIHVYSVGMSVQLYRMGVVCVWMVMGCRIMGSVMSVGCSDVRCVQRIILIVVRSVLVRPLLLSIMRGIVSA